jgi:hypothetical protein
VTITIILLFLTTCQKDEEVTSREFLRIRTLEVTNIYDSGALLNEEIIFVGYSEIKKYGFLLRNDQTLDYLNSEIISKNINAFKGKYCQRISFALETGMQYNDFTSPLFKSG